MSSAAQSMAFVMLICAMPIAGVGAYAFKNREKPGATGLFFCLVGMAGWSVQLAFITWPTQFGPVYVNTTFRHAFQAMVMVGWVLLVWEYVRRDRVQVRPVHLMLLLTIPTLTVLLTATNPWHYLVLAAETPSNPSGISEFVLGPWYIVHMGFAIALVLLPAGVLLNDARGSHGTHRRQTGLLLVGCAIGFPGALNTHLFRNMASVPTYVDLTPIAFLLTTVLWGLAVFRYHLFSVVPVSRRNAIEMMGDPVVSVDAAGTVVDVNPAAAELFGAQSDPIGTELATFCTNQPHILALYERDGKQTGEITIETETGTRHFSLHVRPITQGTSETGSVIVLREITRLREREQELTLLKEVFSRVLRHNIRNQITVVEGHTRAMVDESDDERLTEHTTAILETTDQLLAHSEKARDLRKTIDAETMPITLDLTATVDEELEAYRRANSVVEIDCHRTEGVVVRAHPEIRKAVQELLENATDHYPGDPDELHLEVTVERAERFGRLRIEDNGTGVDPQEVDALRSGSETDLEHGSGVGLWMVDLLLQKSGGEFTIDNDSSLGGACVELALPLADSTLPRESESRSSVGSPRP
ncbi:ATP-binding protein [Halobacteria archaeon AArc-curdl1]|uniref:histidine kinase n=1 Tax=Natronosalvus hydrolyticus TaxID=2979988 RepID=A0AAP2ZAN9_9EURY|nr:ATP-binding protein [Halobacteria archaeon AArc-curdl1]